MMSTAQKKIEGFCNKDMFRPDASDQMRVMFFKDHIEGDEPATLVIGPGRVFTESEVKAMLVNITHECGCYEHRGEPVFATSVDDIKHIAAKHGIVLDPAAGLTVDTDGNVPKVFTTEEVAALVRTVMDIVELIHADPDEARRRIDAAAKTLGITL